MLLTAALATSIGAQSTLHEYRPEVIVTLPRVSGFGVTLLLDERLAMSDLAPTEVMVGMGLVTPQLYRASLAFEVRQVHQINGAIEHRYIPTLYANMALPAGFELRTRTRYEMHASPGQWSRRYISRAAVGHEVMVGDRLVFPYVQSDVYYDTKYDDLNRIDGTVGIRVPLTSGSSIDPFVLRSRDKYRSPQVGIQLGTILRVAL